ncbi:MAG: TolC family outer membrane protein [Chromatiaceae bacterium]|nr:TolC family outer membrane protein [Chromatiaceae bacterium]MCF7995143.1 TolC family outer membrane protein [Chromatiaceae bacterium]MCF8003098.1 TolC family outer membrane protein [Chromatiaceae bacterium]MCF8014413.1 TolC family outer membrane protein [Chromatiaceae bacterium]
MKSLRRAPSPLALLCTLALPALLLATQAEAEDLLQIYDLAVSSDPSLREAEQNFYATREVKPQAKALLLPNFGISGSVDYNNVESRGSNPTQGSFTRNDTFDRSNLSAVVSQSVYNRGDWMRLSQSDDTIAQAEAQYQSAEIDLMVRTTDAYFAVLRASDLVRVQEALVAADERQLEQSKQRFEVGLVAITDVNDNQAAFDRSRANLITAENDLNNAWEALRRIVGPIQVPLARLGDRLPLSPPEPNDINIWAETALANNFDIAAAKAAAEAARKNIEIQRSGYYPSVDMQAGYDLSRTGQEFGTDTDSGFIGLNVNIPLYQGGAVASSTRQAGHQFRAAQDRLDQQRRAVANQVKDAFRGILSSISDVKARQAAIVSARSSLESTEAGLEVGTRTQVDVLNAQRNLFEAEFNYLSARYDYILNGIRLHQATSTLSRDVLAKGNAWLTDQDMVAPPAY